MSSGYMPVSITDNWATPKNLFDKLNISGQFDLDAAASSFNRLCDKWFGLDHPEEARRNGLTAEWDGNRV